MRKKYTDLIELLRLNASKFFNKYSIPRWMLFIHDTSAVFVTFYLAYILRLNFVINDLPSNHIIHGLIALLIYTVFILIYKSYTGIIRHTTLTDISLVFASTTSSALVLVILTLTARLAIKNISLDIPLSVILIHYVLITVFLFFMRISVKMLFMFASSSIRGIKKRVLIYGAGEMGFIVKRVLLSDPRGGFSVFGFIDDNKQLQGKNINGISVFGPDVLNPVFINEHDVETIIIAIKDLSPAGKSDIIKTAIDCNLEILETPAIEKWLNGHLDAKQLEKVKLEDLLGRDPIRLDMDLIRKGLMRKTILVTGAAGSIGSEIIRQLSRFVTHNIILVDQAETPIFHLEYELRKNYSHLKFSTQLGDVTNMERMEAIFLKYRPEIIFHAAAYKHVPLMEENPHEALRVNVGGTRVMVELSIKYKVKKFVLISSDKSVNPTNIMGASKRLCEMLIQTKSMMRGIETQFVITRFGNVLGSNGSVIPLFKKQIEDGGPITVTHPEIKRYFMTIPEACQLVLEAGFIGKGGEIFVFDMGKPIKIIDLAINMIRLSGLEPGKDIKIEFTGLRPGEKLYEELLSIGEQILPTPHEKIKIAMVEKNDYRSEVLSVITSMRSLYNFSEHEIVELFETLVPEYKESKENSNGHYLEKKMVMVK